MLTPTAYRTARKRIKAFRLDWSRNGSTEAHVGPCYHMVT